MCSWPLGEAWTPELQPSGLCLGFRGLFHVLVPGDHAVLWGLGCHTSSACLRPMISPLAGASSRRARVLAHGHGSTLLFARVSSENNEGCRIDGAAFLMRVTAAVTLQHGVWPRLMLPSSPDVLIKPSSLGRKSANLSSKQRAACTSALASSYKKRRVCGIFFHASSQRSSWR